MELLSRVDDLRRARTPYVLATVVRALRPTSAKPGDRALVLADGSIEGFVGGTCAESTVRLQGLRLLETGSSTLLRITPDPGDERMSGEGLVVVGNPCLSGGTLEIFMEAMIPAPLIYVYGDSPIARSLATVGAAAGFEMIVATPAAAVSPDAAAVVVASHGRDEEGVLAAAIRADVPYIALVASHKRGDAVLASVEATRERVRTPAGLDIGARTPPEVAVSILAEIISLRTRSEPPASFAVAVDPVCHMEVAMTPDALTAERDGQTYYFCGPGCRTTFLALA
jgi:xanthine dehydrogenase accessory factor